MTAKVTLETMMIRKIASSFLVAAAAALLAGSPAQAQAQDPKLLGEFQDWAAYTYESDSGPVCYIVSQPTDWEPKNVNRGPIFFLITHRPSERVRNEVNTIIGYPFREGSSATVTVGDSELRAVHQRRWRLGRHGRPGPPDRRGDEGRLDHAPRRRVVARYGDEGPLFAQRRHQCHEQDRRGVRVGRGVPARPALA
jgi:hypothetical protein